MMVGPLRLAGVGFVMQAIALLSFIAISQTPFAYPGKDIVWAASLLAMAALLDLAVLRLSLPELILLALFLSIGFVGILELLGFNLFPGLVKGTEPFTSTHLRKTASAVMYTFALYVAGIGALLAVRRLLKI